ncbi:TPA: hypothetical protein ACH3X3_008946 [Trebouxia sp. C0006]
MSSKQVVVVDFSDFERRKTVITHAVMQAAENEGVFYVKNHGISQGLVDSMFARSADFFKLDDVTKKRYSFDKPRNAGWEKMAQIRPSTGTPDMKESISLGFHTADRCPSEADCTGFADAAAAFMAACQDMSMKLMSCFAIGLGFPEHFFSQHHDVTKTDSQQTMRCLHYHDTSQQKVPANYWRAGAHTDFDTLTLLFQRPGEKGLEICPGRKAVTEFAIGDEWSPADPLEGAITVNIGDMLMQWSDDRLKSTFHRVRMPRPGEYQGPRYSIGFFNQANKSSVIQGPKKKYAPISGLDFILAAMQRNYNALEALKQEPVAA